MQSGPRNHNLIDLWATRHCNEIELVLAVGGDLFPCSVVRYHTESDPSIQPWKIRDDISRRRTLEILKAFYEIFQERHNSTFILSQLDIYEIQAWKA